VRALTHSVFDLIYLLAILALVAVIALIGKGVEKL
jgi:hypothetical protein